MTGAAERQSSVQLQVETVLVDRVDLGCLTLQIPVAGPQYQVTQLVLCEDQHSQRHAPADAGEENRGALQVDARQRRCGDGGDRHHAPLVAPDQPGGQEPEERVVLPVVVPRGLLRLHRQPDLLLVASVAVPVRVDSQHRRPVGVEEGESEPPREPAGALATGVAEPPLEQCPL